MEQKTIGKSKEDYLKTVLIVLKEHQRNVTIGRGADKCDFDFRKA